MANSEEITVEIKVPKTWINQLETLAKERGNAVPVLLREALAKYLELEDISQVVNSPSENYLLELKSLKVKVTELEAGRDRVKELNIRLSVIEQTVAKIQGQIMINSSDSRAELLFLDAEDDEYYYDDEPDEILTDFMPPRTPIQ